MNTEKNKLLWMSMFIIVILSFIILILSLVLILLFIPNELWKTLAIVLAFIFFAIPCFFAIKIESSVGLYKCKKCGNEINPNYNEVVFSAHIGFTRHLECSKCKKKTWHKKIIK